MDPASQSQVYGSAIGVHEGQDSMLTASDLASILKWSKDISSDINLSSGGYLPMLSQREVKHHIASLALQRLTEIATGKLLLGC